MHAHQVIPMLGIVKSRRSRRAVVRTGPCGLWIKKNKKKTDHDADHCRGARPFATPPFAGQCVCADSVERGPAEARTLHFALSTSDDTVVYAPRTLDKRRPCPPHQEKRRERRERRLSDRNSDAGYTMTRQGPNAPLKRLHRSSSNPSGSRQRRCARPGCSWQEFSRTLPAAAFGSSFATNSTHSIPTAGLRRPPDRRTASLQAPCSGTERGAAGCDLPYGPHNLLTWKCTAKPDAGEIILARGFHPPCAKPSRRGLWISLQDSSKSAISV